MAKHTEPYDIGFAEGLKQALFLIETLELEKAKERIQAMIC